MDLDSSPPHISQLDSSAPPSQEAAAADAEISKSEAERLAREEVHAPNSPPRHTKEEQTITSQR